MARHGGAVWRVRADAAASLLFLGVVLAVVLVGLWLVFGPPWWVYVGVSALVLGQYLMGFLGARMVHR